MVKDIQRLVKYNTRKRQLRKKIVVVICSICTNNFYQQSKMLRKTETLRSEIG